MCGFLAPETKPARGGGFLPPKIQPEKGPNSPQPNKKPSNQDELITCGDVKVFPCTEYAGAPGQHKPSLTGPQISKHQTKSRDWVALHAVSKSLEETVAAAKSISPHFIAAQMHDGIFAIVKKNATVRTVAPEGFDTRSVTTAKKTTVQAAASAIRHFMNDSEKFITSLRHEVKQEGYIFTFDECIDAMEDCKNTEGCDKITAAASRARKMKHQEEPDKRAFYEGLLCQKAEIMRYFTHKSEAGLYVLRMADDETWNICGKTWVDACDAAKQLKGKMWDPISKTFMNPTFDMWMNTKLHRNTAALLTGATGAGKSQVEHMCAKTFCKRYDFVQYLFMKGSLDPCGVLTRAGEMAKCGMYCFSDFDCTSLMNSSLSCEELKSLFDVVEGGSFKARYHAPPWQGRSRKSSR